MAEIVLTKKLKSKLNFVNAIGMTNKKFIFPDFLIIGPQKTGTTWLHRNLVLHSDIFMPNSKEIYFLNNLKTGKGHPNDKFRSNRLDWYSNLFKPSLSEFVRKNILLLRSFKNPFLLNYNYINYFSPKALGEATASYAVMDRELIKEAFTLNPDLKIILMIRNPIDRAWSQAKDGFLRKRNIDIEFDNFVEFSRYEYNLKCGDYYTIIENWKAFVKPNNFFTGIFDNIIKEPDRLLSEIFNFLGLLDNKRKFKSIASKKKINPTNKKDIPEKHKLFLKDLLRNQIDRLNSDFNLNW